MNTKLHYEQTHDVLVRNHTDEESLERCGWRGDRFRIRIAGKFIGYECAQCDWRSPQFSRKGLPLPAYLQSLFTTGHIRKAHP